MALQVWLPLNNGTLKQQGLNSVAASGTAFTVDNGGKLGKCIKTTTAGAIDLGYNGNQVNSGSISFGGWFKFNQSEISSAISGKTYTSSATSATGNLIGNNSYGGVSLQWNSNNMYSSGSFSSISVQSYLRSSTNGARATSSFTLPFDTWTHIFLTYDKPGNLLGLWINGELKYTYTCVAFTDARSYNLFINLASIAGGNGPSAYIPFLVNDVRVYDNCLSATEIKKLSQGLILHYPLNRQNWGQKNLLPNTSNEIRTYTYPSSSYQDKWSAQTTEIPSASSYILSFEAKSTVNGDKIRAHYYNPNTTTTCISSQGITKTASDGNMDFTLSTTWKKYWVIYNQSSTTAKKTVIFPRMGAVGNTNGIVSGTGTVSIRRVKFEAGTVATPWCSNIDLFEQAIYDKTIYIESDGSRWIRIAHHNNPSNSLFTSSDTFTTGVYKDVDRWYQIEHVCDYFPQFEFMVKQKTTSDASEVKYRWIQSKNPNQATWTDVQPSMVTRITTSGYTNGSFGGIYKANSSTRMVIANATNGNWYGAFGSWTAYNGGIPGYPNTTITTGYMDLYIRIDNINISGFTIYDCSGYCNNGTWYFYDNNGSYTYTNDTPRYNVSTYIDSVNNTTNTASGSVYLYGNCLLTTPQYLTVAFWCKPVAGYGNSTGQGQFSLTNNDIGANAGSDYQGGPMNHRDSIVDINGSNGTTHKTVSIPFTANEWHHYAVVYDGRYARVYKDGVAGATADMGSNMALGSMKGAVIGFSKAGGVWRSNKSYYSDFRIYATALSADDIKSLYQHGAYIDSIGQIHGKIH